jgi:NTE family protein
VIARLAAGLLLVLGACGAAAAEVEAQKRPRTCVVLSGGGARGAAHVGVLKVLEEYRVPIDCIVGTSMGALVGAAYASGTTVAEMERLVRELSTETLFREKPPREELSMRQKQEEQRNFVGPELGVRDGDFFLPKGAVSGVQLETVLRRLTKVRGYRRFDELPIPLRLVATDLSTGRPAVFGEGELAAVMRASMSVPGAIAPVEIGDTLLVDGGLTNNLPVDIAREMGAEVIIAVNLGSPLLRRKDLNSVVGVAAQMLFILTEQNVQAAIASLTERDVLIEPALGDYSFGDFDHMASTLPIGEAAARKAVGFLRRLALPEAQYAELRRRQLALGPVEQLRIDEIRFEPLARVSPLFAETLLSTRAGEPLNQEVLDRDIRRLYGTGDFEHVGYKVIEENGRRILAIDAVEKSWGPHYLRFGLGASTDFKGDFLFDMIASYRRTWLNPLGLEWKTDLRFGHVFALTSELYQPIDAAGRFFVAPRVEIGRQPVDLYQGNDRLAQFNFRYGRANLDAGMVFGHMGEARVGVVRGKIAGSVAIGPPDTPVDLSTINIGGWTSRIYFDTLDSFNFPRDGWNVAAATFASRTALGATDTYSKWETSGTVVKSLADNTFHAGWYLGGKRGAEPLPAYDQFSAGGFLQLSGYRTNALVGDSIRFGRLMYYRKLVRQTLLEGMYAGFSLEAGKIGTPLVAGAPSGLIKAGSVFLALDTLVGPLYFGYGEASGGASSFYLFLGRP